MQVLKNSYRLTTADVARDIPFAFDVPVGARQVQIELHFDPAGETEVKRCREPILRAMDTYYAGNIPISEEQNWADYLPLKNLITLSLDWNSTYLGNAHRWDNRQIHTFSDTQTPRGFHLPDELHGTWSGMLHVHEVVSAECCVELKIDVEVPDGLAAL